MAEPTNNAANDEAPRSSSIAIGSRQELAAGLAPATRIFVTNGLETYALLTPTGYRMDNSVQEGVLLANQAHDCFMMFRIAAFESDTSTNLNSDYCRTMLSNRYPDVRILEEFPQKVGGLAGLAFDFEWKGYAKTLRTSRVIFVSSPTGVLEFSLVCNPGQFQQVCHDFDQLLLTFRASKDGTLQIAPRSNQI